MIVLAGSDTSTRSRPRQTLRVPKSASGRRVTTRNSVPCTTTRARRCGGGRHDEHRAKQLLRQIPVLAGAPTADVARCEHTSGHQPGSARQASGTSASSGTTVKRPRRTRLNQPLRCEVPRNAGRLRSRNPSGPQRRPPRVNGPESARCSIANRSLFSGPSPSVWIYRTRTTPALEADFSVRRYHNGTSLQLNSAQRSRGSTVPGASCRSPDWG